MILKLIQRARRRFLWNEIFSSLALAAALVIGALILLLLFGTQILDWRILAVVCAAGLGIFLYRTFRRLPPPYKIAIFLDHRAELQDSLSTALFFEDPSRGFPGNASVRAAQRSHAERLLDRIDLARALPFTLPKAAYAVGALGLVASSLFALRYGIDRRLDLKPPLTSILMDSLGISSQPSPQTAALAKKKGGGKNADPLSGVGVALPQSEQKRAGNLDKAPDSALDTIGVPEVNNEKEDTGKKAGQVKSEGGDKADSEKGDPEDSDQGSPASAGKNASDNLSGGREGPQQGEQSGGKQASSGENSSLMSKLKDAVSNLLSKAKQQPSNAGGQKPGDSQNGQQAKAQQLNGEKGGGGKGQQAGGKESGEAQDGEQAGDSQNDESAPGKGGGKSADQQAASQPGSGIGKQDGSKDVKAAEQLAAMGKLSEIIGKRSANVTGEMTVEVPSGPQQLHTAYSQRNAKHGDSGGEVSRDEVPVEVQSYVQQYFEEIRKAPAPAKAKRTETP